MGIFKKNRKDDPDREELKRSIEALQAIAFNLQLTADQFEDIVEELKEKNDLT